MVWGLIPKQLTKENGEILAQHFENLANFILKDIGEMDSDLLGDHHELESSIFVILYRVLSEINYLHEIDVKELYSFALSLNREEILSTITPRLLGIDTESEYITIIANKFISYKKYEDINH